MQKILRYRTRGLPRRERHRKDGDGGNGGVLNGGGKTKSSCWFVGKGDRLLMWNPSVHWESWTGGGVVGLRRAVMRWGRMLLGWGRKAKGSSVGMALIGSIKQEARLLAVSEAVPGSHWSLNVDMVWNSCAGEHKKSPCLRNKRTDPCNLKFSLHKYKNPCFF